MLRRLTAIRIPCPPCTRYVLRHPDDDWKPEACEPGQEGHYTLSRRLYPAQAWEPPGTVIEADGEGLFPERWVAEVFSGVWDPTRPWRTPDCLVWRREGTDRAVWVGTMQGWIRSAPDRWWVIESPDVPAVDT